MSINLIAFCGQEKARSWMAQPFAIGAFTYATNGHVAIRVDGNVALDVPDAPKSIEGLFAEAVEREFVSFASVDAEPIKPKRCDQCSGHGYTIECDVCDGEGEHECDNARCGCVHDCGSCRGKGCEPALKGDDDAEPCDWCGGAGRELDKRSVNLGHWLVVQRRYLQLVQALPGPIKWAVKMEGSEHKPPAFRGPGWLAIIMPMRPSGHEDITATRLPNLEQSISSIPSSIHGGQ